MFASLFLSSCASSALLAVGLTQIVEQPPADDPAAVAENDTIVVTARRTAESEQDVPIPLTVIGGDALAEAGAFNVNRLKEQVPTVQFYSSNPRNSAINIRGLGAPFGLTNDGIEPGAGLYIDGVFYARPALATLDFVDIAQVEVLRGPQGTLYGKNTTAGAVNITTRLPSAEPEIEYEITGGNYGFVQAKGSVSGPLAGDELTGRFSFSGTQRDGFVYNVASQDDVNDLSNLGLRGQLLFTPKPSLDLRLIGDYTRQRPEGYVQVVTDIVPTLRDPSRQFPAIAEDLGYTVPSLDPFDRITDADTPHRSNQDVGGLSLNADWEIGDGTLSSISAWRFWDWDPSNDRDYLGLPITTISANPSKQEQYSQELRYAGPVGSSIDLVVGAFAFYQTIDSTGLQEQGAAAARFLLDPSVPGADTPGLLDGLRQESDIASDNLSLAVFTQLDIALTDRLHLIPGVRLNYDEKSVDFVQTVSGGLQTDDPVLVDLQQSVLSPQAYEAETDDTNTSWNLTVAYEPASWLNLYATYATAFKSVGLNLSGVPADADGNPALDAATIAPEDVRHIEVGLKSQPWSGVTINLSAFDTEIEDYQANVVNAQVGVLRGYLANAKKVRVRGVEVDARARFSDRLATYAAIAYTDGEYVTFEDAPVPIELTGGPRVFDASGTDLPGLSKWAASLGAEATQPGRILSVGGEFFAAADASYRSDFSSSASYSPFLIVDDYATLNLRAGFRSDDGWDVFAWGRNVTETDYFEFLSAAPGGTGLIAGYPGDPATWGITLRGRL